VENIISCVLLSQRSRLVRVFEIIDRLDRQSQCTTFESSRDAVTTSESTNGKKRAVIFEAMTLIAQMIQSVTSIFQLLAASLMFIYEDGEAFFFRVNLIDTKLRRELHSFLHFLSNFTNKWTIIYSHL